MNTKTKAFIILLLITQFNDIASAQSTYQFGILPSINLNNKLKNNWSLNSKIESRQLIRSGELNENLTSKYTYVLTDFSLIAAKKVGLNSRIGGGYLIRFEESAFIHRFIQQSIIVQKLSGFRLAHRFLSDQTFSNIERPEFRLRYRITAEIPLNGKSVDHGEFYVKINNEYVNSLQAYMYDLEIRMIPLLGYDISNRFKIETGLDYRVDSFIGNAANHSYWLTLNFFIDIE